LHFIAIHKLYIFQILVIFMGFNADDDEHDYEFSCPDCGSSKVVVEEEHGVYHISRCKKCRYKKDSF